MMKIMVLGPGCPNCQELERRAKKALEELKVEATVTKVADFAEISKYIMMTPGLVINEKVKHSPVINDALIEDAIACGIDEHAQIMSSGSDAPGTVLKFCSPEFLKLYESSEMIISKGQGNFEALSDEDRPIFFLFKVKCPVIAKDIKGNLSDVILKSNLKKRGSND